MGEICLGVVVKNLGVALVLLLDSAIDFFSGLLNFLGVSAKFFGL